ncbi:MAG TPA: hypothetical protein VF441_09030 [Acidimicrobiia bacterium]
MSIRHRVRAGVRAGAIAAILSGLPSTVHTLMRGGDLTESTQAVGTVLLGDDAPPGSLLLAGAAAHVAISLGWAAVLAAFVPSRHPVRWGIGAGLVIAALDLGVIGRRFARVRALPPAPQIADHMAFGAVVALVVSGSRGRIPAAGQ